MKRLKVMGLLLALPMGVLAESQAVFITDVRQIMTERGKMAVTGVAYNQSDKALKHLMVVYKVYQEGKKVQSSPTSLLMLKPGERWRFSTVAVMPFDHYELQSVTYQYADAAFKGER